MSQPSKLGAKLAAQGDAIDSRYHPSAAVRRQLNKVFPTHWSFLLGEIALYSFLVLLLTGVYLTLFFDPSMTDVIYHGVYQPLRGIEMSRAYESALDISFEVRGGLFVRQIHHWAALMFAAAIMVHMARIFFTGAFRKPREFNWLIGVGLTTFALLAGFSGYSLPDDLLSGTGLQIARGERRQQHRPRRLLQELPPGSPGRREPCPQWTDAGYPWTCPSPGVWPPRHRTTGWPCPAKTQRPERKAVSSCRSPKE